MKKNIILVGENRDGTGKALLASATVTYLQLPNGNILLLDSNIMNPDVWAAQSNNIKPSLFNVDSPLGWADLVNLCRSNSNRVVVIDASRRNANSVSAYCKALEDRVEHSRWRAEVLKLLNGQGSVDQ